MARATSDCTRRESTKRSMSRDRRSLDGPSGTHGYFLPDASSSKKRSYMTEPGFHLPSVLDAAYGEGRYTTGTPECSLRSRVKRLSISWLILSLSVCRLLWAI